MLYCSVDTQSEDDFSVRDHVQVQEWSVFICASGQQHLTDMGTTTRMAFAGVMKTRGVSTAKQ